MVSTISPRPAMPSESCFASNTGSRPGDTLHPSASGKRRLPSGQPVRRQSVSAMEELRAKIAQARREADESNVSLNHLPGLKTGSEQTTNERTVLERELYDLFTALGAPLRERLFAKADTGVLHVKDSDKAQLCGGDGIKNDWNPSPPTSLKRCSEAHLARPHRIVLRDPFLIDSTPL